MSNAVLNVNLMIYTGNDTRGRGGRERAREREREKERESI